MKFENKAILVLEMSPFLFLYNLLHLTYFCKLQAYHADAYKNI